MSEKDGKITEVGDSLGLRHRVHCVACWLCSPDIMKRNKKDSGSLYKVLYTSILQKRIKLMNEENYSEGEQRIENEGRGRKKKRTQKQS